MNRITNMDIDHNITAKMRNMNIDDYYRMEIDTVNKLINYLFKSVPNAIANIKHIESKGNNYCIKRLVFHSNYENKFLQTIKKYNKLNGKFTIDYKKENINNFNMYQSFYNTQYLIKILNNSLAFV